MVKGEIFEDVNDWIFIGGVTIREKSGIEIP